MSKPEVEKVIKEKLQPFVLDSSAKKQDSLRMKWGCKDCSEDFIYKYEDVTLILTFFRYTLYKQTDYELAAITPYPSSPLIQTKSGIKVGITEESFLGNCKENKYPFTEMIVNEKDKGYLFSDNPNKEPGKAIMVYFSNGFLIFLMVIDMIGD